MLAAMVDLCARRRRGLSVDSGYFASTPGALLWPIQGGTAVVATPITRRSSADVSGSHHAVDRVSALFQPSVRYHC
jgi:hypothetical protein